jgi:hypothetical protein
MGPTPPQDSAEARVYLPLPERRLPVSARWSTPAVPPVTGIITQPSQTSRTGTQVAIKQYTIGLKVLQVFYPVYPAYFVPHLEPQGRKVERTFISVCHAWQPIRLVSEEASSGLRCTFVSVCRAWQKVRLVSAEASGGLHWGLDFFPTFLFFLRNLATNGQLKHLLK